MAWMVASLAVRREVRALAREAALRRARPISPMAMPTVANSRALVTASMTLSRGTRTTLAAIDSRMAKMTAPRDDSRAGSITAQIRGM